MKRIIPTLIFGASIIFYHCNGTSTNKSLPDSEIQNSIIDSQIYQLPKGSIDTVKIDFNKNKKLLDIIVLLPEDDFESWEWKLEDRIKWYSEIKNNDYYIDNNPNSFNLTHINPSGIVFNIVDGSWSANIYTASDNSTIIITDDIASGGNSLRTYEVKGNNINRLDDINPILSNYKDIFIKEVDSIKCKDLSEVLNFPLWEYHFFNSGFEIEDSWNLTQSEYGQCLNGNAVLFYFNTKTKKFDIEKIYWKQKQL